tara:strand:- start:10379 stop:10603 length:225 start_codon:yes stop_codon:yes gene_type:complete
VVTVILINHKDLPMTGKIDNYMNRLQIKTLERLSLRSEFKTENLSKTYIEILAAEESELFKYQEQQNKIDSIKF